MLCYGPEQVGFQTRVILDLWGMVFHAMVAFGLGLDLLFKSIWACCVLSSDSKEVLCQIGGSHGATPSCVTNCEVRFFVSTIAAL